MYAKLIRRHKVQFLKNTWYVAAWQGSVTRQLLARTILGEPLLFYRKLDGGVAAISDRCPHRFAPLSMGKLVGDNVECGYHGLQFDCNGACVLNPHGDGKIPRAAVVRHYPVVERYGFVWVWMGEVERADPALMPDYSHLTSEAFTTVGGEMVQQANYELVVDNLMDLSHAMYLHADYQRTDDFLTARHDVSQENGILYSKRFVPGTRAPVSFRTSLPDPDAPVDYWLDVQWSAPGLCVLEIGVVPAGHDRQHGIRRLGTHFVTPQTETSSLYFYASSRNYRLNDTVADDEIKNWQDVGFHQQDKPMIEAVQRMMNGQTDLMALKPILLPPDAASMRARRLLRQLIAEENFQPAHA